MFAVLKNTLSHFILIFTSREDGNLFKNATNLHLKYEIFLVQETILLQKLQDNKPLLHENDGGT